MNHAIRNMAYEFRRKYGKVFTALYLSSLLLCLPFLILRLTNDMDGMWDQDDHITGAAELRMGRWFWPILDKLRLNVSLDPLPALISLAVFSCGVILLLSLMNVRTESRREQLFAWTIGMMILASPTVLCQLSYSHMTINDAVSFLLAVLAVWLLRKRKIGRWEILLSGLMIALMMGGYQATLGVTCVAALFAFVRMLQQREQVRNALAFAGRMLLAILLGAVLYEVFLHLGLVLTGQTLSDYNGADAITFTGVLGNLPSSIWHTYTAFGFYFGGNGYHFNLLQSQGWFRFLYLIPAGIALFCIREAGNALSSILMIAAFLLIPVFANSFFLLAVSAETMMQMTMGMALVLPLVFCLTNWKKRLSGIVIAALFLILYGEAGQNVNDQYAMYAGRRATTAIAEQVMDCWVLSGIDYTENVVLVYGTPEKSPLFSKADLYDRANSYAQYGRFAPTSEGNRLCWSHFFEQQLRVNVNYAEGDTLETIYHSPEAAAMPVYPAAGSVANVWGVTVVKVSE